MPRSSQSLRDEWATTAVPDQGPATYTANLFCLCAGAIDSAVVLLASADDIDPADTNNQTGETTVAAPGRIRLSCTPNNVKSFDRLKDRRVDTLKKAGHANTSILFHAHFKKGIPPQGVGHQNGTCRMGLDAATSVLDANCKAHDFDNLYVVDAACFLSASAVTPLTHDHRHRPPRRRLNC